MNKKLGAQADSIFSKPKQAAYTSTTPTRGRPSKGLSLTKTTTVLSAEQIYWLDSLSSKIKLNTGASLSRSEILRGLIEFAKESNINFADSVSEQDIKNKILENI